MSKSMSILLAATFAALLVSLEACVTRTPGIEVSMTVMPLDAALVMENADLGMNALEITSLELIPCASEPHPPGAHSHETMDSFLVKDEPSILAWRMAPGRYCDVRVGVSLEGAAPREAVLRTGCADGRLPIALSHAQRNATLVLSFPSMLDVQRIGESDIDRQRALDALMRGLVVERVDCETIQP